MLKEEPVFTGIVEDILHIISQRYNNINMTHKTAKDILFLSFEISENILRNQK